MENEKFTLPKEVVVKQEGFTFVFTNFSVTSEKQLTFNCLYVEENQQASGYFAPDKPFAIFYDTLTIQGQDYDAITLPKESYDLFLKIRDHLYDGYDAVKDKVVKGLVDGSILVTIVRLHKDRPDYVIVELQDIDYLEGYNDAGIMDDILMDAFIELSKTFGVRDAWSTLESVRYCSTDYFADILDGKTSVERFNIVYDEDGTPMKCKVRLRDLIEPSVIEEAKKEQAERSALDKRLNALQVKVLSSNVSLSDDFEVIGALDPWAIVEVTDPQTKESLRFLCRNIIYYDWNILGYDFTISPDYPLREGLPKGGLPNLESNRWVLSMDDGKEFSREMTPFERKCVEYLNEFKPVGFCVMERKEYKRESLERIADRIETRALTVKEEK